MNMMTTMPPPDAWLLPLAQLLRRFERNDMDRAVDLLLAMMDARDGDIDAEMNGDEFEGCGAQEEEAGWPEPAWVAPGSIEDCEQGWIEWHTRGRYKLDGFGAERQGTDRCGNPLREDDEDDDAAEACGDETDGNLAEDDFAYHGLSGPGCPISDPGGGNIVDQPHDEDAEDGF